MLNKENIKELQESIKEANKLQHYKVCRWLKEWPLHIVSNYTFGRYGTWLVKGQKEYDVDTMGVDDEDDFDYEKELELVKSAENQSKFDNFMKWFNNGLIGIECELEQESKKEFGEWIYANCSHAYDRDDPTGRKGKTVEGCRNYPFSGLNTVNRLNKEDCDNRFHNSSCEQKHELKPRIK